jgi:hypothetical protein
MVDWKPTSCLLTACLLYLSLSDWRAYGGSYPPGWEGLSDFKEIPFAKVVEREPSRVILYYIDRSQFHSVRYDLLAGKTDAGDLSGHPKFLCAIARGQKIAAVSACASSTGTLSAKGAEVVSTLLFGDTIDTTEIDPSVVLHDGKNLEVIGLFHPFIQLDEILGTQRIGDGDFAALCSSLQLTASDGIGAVHLLKTKRRPHVTATYAVIADDPALTQTVALVHLKLGYHNGYVCDEAITLPSNIVLLISRDQLLALDYQNKIYGVVDLPMPRGSYLLARVVSH